MMRVMLDSDRIDIILALNGAAPLLATYSDLVPHPDDLQKKLTHSKLVLIDRKLGDPSGKASVCDIEDTLFTPQEFPGWYDKKKAAGIEDLTAYVNRSNIAEVDKVAGNRSFFRWVSTLDGTCHIAGFPDLRAPAAVQVLGSAQVGVHADLSLVYENQWNATQELAAADLIPIEHNVAAVLAALHKLTG